MRMYPPAPILSRYCSEDTTIGEGIFIEKVSTSDYLNQTLLTNHLRAVL